MKAILLAALIAAGAYGAHYLTTHPNLGQGQADQSEAIVEASPADAAIEPDRDHAQKRLSELEADNQNLAARLKEANDRLQTATQWQAEATKFKDNLAVIVADRDHWQQEAQEWEKLARASDNAATKWQELALKNKSVAEQNAAIAQQNAITAAQWQAASKQPPPVPWSAFDKFDQRRAAIDAARAAKEGRSGTAAPPPLPTPQVIEIESNGKWATDSAGNAYRIDSLGNRKIIDMTK